MAIMKNKNLSNSLAQQKKENKIDTNWHKFRQWWGYLQGHEIFRKNIQWEASEKDLDENYKKQEAVRKVKPITKRILLIHATEETQENLEVDDGEEPLIRKGICKGEKISYVEIWFQLPQKQMKEKSVDKQIKEVFEHFLKEEQGFKKHEKPT